MLSDDILLSHLLSDLLYVFYAPLASRHPSFDIDIDVCHGDRASPDRADPIGSRPMILTFLGNHRPRPSPSSLRLNRRP